ncbi:MAG: ATP-binding protein [Oscillospiraceae bacterium]|jgi:AAA+ ATPase superfamily predicted ATPase|nr:ATP-binding protein [Oscillospiraceae bacterium]
MKPFINRTSELSFLNEQYASASSSFVVVYGRRRVGKTTLIKEFMKDKQGALYFLASEEVEAKSMGRFAAALAEFTGSDYLKRAAFESWHDLFDVLSQYKPGEKKILVIDEFPYLVEKNAAFPSILQTAWDEKLGGGDFMLILSGSLIHMMEKYALNYSSPLYGRRTGQIKLRQIDFRHYHEFFPQLSYHKLVEFYAVTGGVPKYIELFDGHMDLFAEIDRLILNRDSLLFEEPVFLLQREVSDIGSYFSIIQSIAAGNHKPGKIATDLGVKQTNLPKYLKTLIDMDIIQREVPITETNPEKSKMALYQIKDNFLRFWFRFVYPEKSRLELDDSAYVLEKIKANFVDNHAAFIYESVCLSELWGMGAAFLPFNKAGRWWSAKEEIDIVALDTTGDSIIFAECKYHTRPVGADVFDSLLRKKETVPWKNGARREQFALFSISGFTEQLLAIAQQRDDLLLIGTNGPVAHL